VLKLARLDDLRRRLVAALADRPALARRFDEALGRQDDVALDAAFAALRAEPGETRRAVEALVLDWLFGEGDRLEPAQVAPTCAETRH